MGGLSGPKAVTCPLLATEMPKGDEADFSPRTLSFDWGVPGTERRGMSTFFLVTVPGETEFRAL